MKRTVVKIKTKDKTDEIWCDVNGRIFELMGAYIALTQNLIGTFKKRGNNGETALKMMFADAIEEFEKNGIKVKEIIKNA